MDTKNSWSQFTCELCSALKYPQVLGESRHASISNEVTRPLVLFMSSQGNY